MGDVSTLSASEGYGTPGIMQEEAGRTLLFQNLAEFQQAGSQILRFQSGMRAVAKGGFFTVLAPAPGHLLFIFDFHLHGGNVSSGVGAIAKWLSL